MDHTTHPRQAQTPSKRKARRKHKTEFAGAGALVQLVGVILLFVFPIGTLAGIVLLIIGHSMSTKLICSECGNQIEGKQVKICPTCQAAFK